MKKIISLFSAFVMLLSIILWPTLTKRYTKRLNARKQKEIDEKYSAYLEIKRDELEKERNLLD